MARGEGACGLAKECRLDLEAGGGGRVPFASIFPRQSSFSLPVFGLISSHDMKCDFSTPWSSASDLQKVDGRAEETGILTLDKPGF